MGFICRFTKPRGDVLILASQPLAAFSEPGPRRNRLPVLQSIKLPLDELNTLFRVQFPVMQQVEQDTRYDKFGRIVFTSRKGLNGVSFPRKGSGRGAKRARLGRHPGHKIRHGQPHDPG